MLNHHLRPTIQAVSALGSQDTLWPPRQSRWVHPNGQQELKRDSHHHCLHLGGFANINIPPLHSSSFVSGIYTWGLNWINVFINIYENTGYPWIAILLGKMMIIRYSMGYPVFRNQRLRISRWALAGPEAGSLPLSVSATAPRATDNLFGFPSAKSSLHRVWWICGSSSKVTKSIANQSMWKLEIISKDEKPNSSWSRATKNISWGYPMWLWVNTLVVNSQIAAIAWCRWGGLLWWIMSRLRRLWP